MLRTLDKSDRCDRCGAQAYVSALVRGTWLVFCGHHFRKHEEAIRRVAVTVVDERDAIPA